MKSLKAKFRKSDTNEWNKNDERLLQAVEHGDSEKVASLLAKKGVGATKQDSEGKTAFHVAATKGSMECLRIMLTHGVDVMAQDAMGHSALHLAAKNSHLDCAKKLLQSKCPAEGTDNSGKTALHYAAASGCLQIVQLLCEHKCPVNIKDLDGNSSLLIAVQSGHIEVCRYLLTHGADINSRDKNGRTAIMLACETGILSLVELLVKKGADLKLVDALGHSVLHYSKLSENAEIHNLLLSKISHQDASTKTPTKPKQLSDLSSPQSTTSTPLSGKGEKLFFEQAHKEESSCFRQNIKNRLSDYTGADSLLNVSCEAEQEDVLSTLQAKISALMLHNRELQDKLQEKELKERRTNISTDSFHSTHSELDQSMEKHTEVKTQETKLHVSTMTEFQVDKSNNREVSIEQLQEKLQDLQMKLDYSETEKEHLIAQLQSGNLGTAYLNSGEISENGSNLNQKLQEMQNKYEEAMKEVSSLQKQVKLGHGAPENVDNNLNVHELQATCEEINALKEEYDYVLAESERDKKTLKELELKLEGMEKSMITMVSEEKQEEIRKSYCSIIEDINQEKALLIIKYKESQEEGKRLQDKLKQEKQPESPDESGEVKQMTRTIDELSRQVTELSLLYNEAQTELEQRKRRETLQDASSGYIRSDEHEKLMQEVNKLKIKAETALADIESQYKKASNEVAQLKQELKTEKQNSVLVSEQLQVIMTLKNTVKDMEDEKNELKAHVISKEFDIENLQERLLQEKAEVHETMVPRESYEKLKSSLEEEINVLSSSLKEMMEENEKVCSDNVHIKKEILCLKEEREAAQALLKTKEQEVCELRLQYSQAQEDLAEMKNYCESTSKLKEDKDKTINELTKEVCKLKEALNSLSQLSFSTSTPKRQSQQLETLQQQVKQLQSQLVESKKQHQEIVSVYRTHLLYAVQGQMDEDVQRVLKQILTMCKSQSPKK
ncbi:ankycorbin isoform X2 [Microcaecilia unicolor]|uniref:Ankycorbin isoform X2 n=1 Tax=Microcaecilia unicolor TaxID=1415580 RepID=A0A6P7XF86_9AMPH|nr:ankycorbin isoform X2 [Microcaecilia unicolor]